MMNYSAMTQREVEIELATSVSEGLSSFTAHDRLIDNGRNTPERTYSKSVFSVWMSQFTNLYTIAFFVMGIITALCDFKNSMAAWIIFFAVAVVNMVSGFLRDNGERKLAVRFDSMRSDEVKIIRDSKLMRVDPTLLVKGDVVVLKKGDFVPADIRIMNAEALKADESIFKGRNVPIDKQADRLEGAEDPAECKNMLYCGSTIASGSGVGVIVATGKDTTLARINLNKSRKLDMHDRFGKNVKSEKMLTCAAVVTAIVVMTAVSLIRNTPKMAIMQACTAALCLLPAPVFAIRLLAVKIAGKRLAGEQVEMDKGFVYDIGMSEYLLFDKGGLLTDSDVKLEEKVISDGSKLEMAVICSDCEFEGERLYGNDMDRATARALMEEGVDVKKLLEENEKLLFMPFDEQRKIMAALVKIKTGYRIIVKGSIDTVPTMCTFISDGDGTVEMSGEVLHRLENISSSMGESGLKIRAVAYRDIDFVPENIEDEIKGLIFAGVLGYRESTARKAREAIKRIESVYVKPIMVTGDNKITAAAIARGAGLIKSEAECISFRELGECSDDELMRAAERYKVFAAASREDRERLVKVLSENSFTTAVAGEQMTAPTVAMYANVTFGDKEKEHCDVTVDRCDIDKVGDIIYKASATRGNLAYASLLAISVGLAEVVVMLVRLFAYKAMLPATIEMLMLNLFVVCVPCMAVAVLGGVRFPLKSEKLLAVRCILQGVICAFMCLISGSDIITFAALYAIAKAGMICISFADLKKDRKGIFSAVAMAIVLVIAVVVTKATPEAVLWALLAVAINTIIPYLKWKGWKK